MVVTVTLLGGLAIEVDGVAVPAREWNRRQSASLVKLLALTPGHRLHREQVIDALWPDLAVDEAAPRLHKAAHFARKAMGWADSIVLSGDVVAGWPGRQVCVDAEEFERCARAALAAGDQELAERAMARYRGDLLPHDLYEPWAQAPRERLRGLRHDLLRLGQRWEAILDLDPADEEAHVSIMRRLAEQGDRLGALRQYERLERALSAELGLRPGARALGIRAALVRQGVDGAAAARSAPMATAAPIAPAPASSPVGREGELAVVDELMSALRRPGPGGGRVLFVSGPPGSGKTCLVTALLERARARGIRTGLGVAAASSAPWPYSPVLEALADLCRRHPALLDGLEDPLRQEIERALAGRDLDWTGESGRQRLFVAVAELVRLAAAGTAVVLVIDDAHGADEASVRLVHYVSRATTSDRVLLVLAHRDPPATAHEHLDRGERGETSLPPASAAPEFAAVRRDLFARAMAQSLTLAPLSRDDVAVLVRRHAADADDAAIDSIYDASAGYPLAVTELASVLGERAAPGSLARLWLDGLPEMVLDAVRAAAVLGVGFDTDEFLAVATDTTNATADSAAAPDEEAAFAALERALSARLVVRQERGFSFRHPLVREAVLEGVCLADLRGLHRRAASALTRLDAPAARIAHHLLEGGQRAQAIPYALRAAQTQAALGAYRDALATLDAVAEHASGPDLAWLLSIRADLLLACGNAGAVEAYRAALTASCALPEQQQVPGQDAGPRRLALDQARLRARLARAATFAGDLETAAEALDGVSLDGGDADGDVLLALGNLALFQGDLDAADAAASQARRRLSLGAGGDWRMFDLVALQGLVAHKRGRWFDRLRWELRRGQRRPDLAAGIFDSHLCVAEYLLYGPTPYEEIMELAAGLRSTAEHAGVLRAVGFACALRGEAALLHGDLDLAQAELGEAVALHHDLELSAGEAHSLQRLAEVHLARGDREQATALLNRALPLARWSTIALHLLQRIFGSLVRAAPDAVTARAWVDRGIASMSRDDQCTFCSIMFDIPAVRACVDVGDLEQARRHLDAASRSAAMWEGTSWPAAVLEARAHLAGAEGDQEAARDLRREAAALYDSSGQPLDAARCRA